MRAREGFGVPALLVAFSAIPMAGGVARLADLSGPATAATARFVASPLPLAMHIGAAAVFCLVGAFQFSAPIRARWPRWHRRAGMVVVASGVVAAVTGLWMTARYPIPEAMQGPALYAVRMLVGTAMALAIVASLRAIARRDVARHEAWMIRAYALGQGAGTQALVLGPWLLAFGEAVGPTRDALMAMTWAINLGVAEWIIGRRALSAQDRRRGHEQRIVGAAG